MEDLVYGLCCVAGDVCASEVRFEGGHESIRRRARRSGGHVAPPGRVESNAHAKFPRQSCTATAKLRDVILWNI